MFTGRDRIDDFKLVLKNVKKTGNKSFKIEFKVNQFEDIIKDIEDDLDELDELRDVQDTLVDFEDFVKIFKYKIELFSTYEEGIPTYGFIIGFEAHYVSKEEYELLEKIFRVVK